MPLSKGLWTLVSFVSLETSSRSYVLSVPTYIEFLIAKRHAYVRRKKKLHLLLGHRSLLASECSDYDVRLAI